MHLHFSKQRVYASLIIFGASILLFRTLRMMLIERAFEILVSWVVGLLITEFLIDLACIITSFRWLILNDRSKATIPLRLGAAAAILHAIRVLIYVIGRIGPWINFDVKQEYHFTYTTNWFWVYFAAILSILGVLGVIIISQIIRYKAN